MRIKMIKVLLFQTLKNNHSIFKPSKIKMQAQFRTQMSFSFKTRITLNFS